MDSLIVLSSLFAPFLLWPVEHLLPYPYFIEESLKAVIVFFGLNYKEKHSGKELIIISILTGIAFTVSETVMYSININSYGDSALFLKRFFLTGLLHTFTFLILIFSGKKRKKHIFFGFLINILIHYFYNSFI